MDDNEGGRGRGGRPPLRGRRGRGRRPPLAARGRGRGRQPIGGRGQMELVQRRQIQIHPGDDIVSSIEMFARVNRYPFLFVEHATGRVSELSVVGRGIINAGSYVIQSLKGFWSETILNGDQFALYVDLRVPNSTMHIYGHSRFLLAEDNVTVYVQILISAAEF